MPEVGEQDAGALSSLTVRIPASLKSGLQRVAMDDDRSVNYIVNIFSATSAGPTPRSAQSKT